MKLVITLRNGVQLSTGVKDFEIRQNSMTGGLNGLNWTYDGDPHGTSIGWVDMAEVVAVHSLRDDKGDDTGTIGKPSGSPMPAGSTR